MKTKIIQNIKSIILALILVVGVSYVSASSTWVNPTATAPGNNADMPLNTSSAGQTKTGGLVLNTGGASNGLTVYAGSTILKGAVQITSGTPGAGKVLVSDISGNASWGTAGTTNVYSCPVKETCDNGSVPGGVWASYGCVGQISVSATCKQLWWTDRLYSCVNTCTLVGKI